MIGMVVRQLRARLARTIALLTGVAVATTGFIILTSTAQTSRLDVVGMVESNSRAAYDVLVRPRDARSSVESQRDLLRPNHLSGLYGGITSDQWMQIRAVPGVEVAAPIAMVGYAAAVATVDVDLTSILDLSKVRQVIRLRSTWIGDSGLTSSTEDVPRFAYVTKRPVAVPEVLGVQGTGEQPSYRAPDGTLLHFEDLWKLGCSYRQIPFLYLEQQENGSWQPICGTWFLTGKDAKWFEDNPGEQGSSELNQAQFYVIQALPDGKFSDFTAVIDPSQQTGQGGSTSTTPKISKRAQVHIDWPLWLPMAAIDPDQESQLIGLDGAVTSGRYLPRQSEPCEPNASVPVLVPERAPVTEQLNIRTERIAVSAVPVAAMSPQALLSQLSNATGDVGQESTYQAADVYQTVLSDPSSAVHLDVTLAAAAPQYAVLSDGTLHPLPVAMSSGAWRTPVSRFGELATGENALQPYLANDGGHRKLSSSDVRPLHDVTQPRRVQRTGTFDPDRLREFSRLSAVPLETYRSTQISGADQRSQRLLGDAVLSPGNNPAAYVAAPPSMLMPLDAAKCLLDRPDPISAVRVRVAGVIGVDPVSRERVRLVAEKIAMQTGLDVDVTLGTSPEPQTVKLSPGKLGRPELSLHEGWSKRGVAVNIIKAVDKKSATLFILILVVCVLFLGTATSAAVRDRHRELAVLACLGWPAWRRGALILSEVMVIGCIAGAVSMAISVPLAQVQGIEIRWSHAVMAVPVALGVTTLAAAVPALRASRTAPGAALHTPMANAGRARVRGGFWSLAIVNLLRTPGRTLTAIGSLAIGVASLLLLLSLIWVFDGVVVGTMLGDAVSLQARTADVAAVAAIVALAAGAVADVLYLNVRERAQEFATLWALGWTVSDLNKMLLREATCVGLLGGAAGIGSGLAGITWFAADMSAQLAIATVAALAGALVLAAFASLVPMLFLRRIPMTTLLAGE